MASLGSPDHMARMSSRVGVIQSAPSLITNLSARTACRRTPQTEA